MKAILLILLIGICSAASFTWPEWEFIKTDLDLITQIKDAGKIEASFSNGSVDVTADAAGVTLEAPGQTLNLTWVNVYRFWRIYWTVEGAKERGIDTGTYTDLDGWEISFSPAGISVTPP